MGGSIGVGPWGNRLLEVEARYQIPNPPFFTQF
jgi:hypothetical protein